MKIFAWNSDSFPVGFSVTAQGTFSKNFNEWWKGLKKIKESISRSHFFHTLTSRYLEV